MIKVIYFIAGNSPTPQEKAEIDQLNAGRFDILIRTGTIEPEYGYRDEFTNFVLGSVPPDAAWQALPLFQPNSGGSGQAVWGTITGLISSQTDLQSALNSRVTDSALTAILADFSLVGHVHTINNITGLQAALNDLEAAGTAASIMTTHENLANPHMQYLLASTANSTFSLVGHSHEMNEVFGLVNALNAKQDAGDFADRVHGHTIVDIAGLATALADKEPALANGTTLEYIRGDKSLAVLDKTAIGLNNVNNTSDAAKPISDATQSALNGKATIGHSHGIADVAGLQTALNEKEPAIAPGNASQYIRGDKSLATFNKAAIGLGSVDNTPDLDKPISNLMQTALNGKSATGHGHVLSDISGLGTLATQNGTFSGNSSGTNTGDQTITLTGAVTGSGTGSFAATLTDGSVTNAKLANAPSATVKGRTAAGTGVLSDLTGAEVNTLLPAFTGALKGLTPASGGGTENFLRADGSWAVPAGGGAPGGYSSASRFYAFNDFIGLVSGSEWTYTVSGTGAAHATLDFPETNSIGAVRATLGTVATGRCSIGSPSFLAFQLGQGVAKWAARLRLDTLSDATNTYVLRNGFIDSVTTESFDGVFFRYTNGVNGGRFEAVTRSNNVETAQDTGIIAALSTTYKFEIEVNAAGSSVSFKINGALTNTIATNIPNANARELGYGIYTQRTVGTASITSYLVDYLNVDLAFTNSR